MVPFLTLAYMVNITTGVGSTIAIAAGHPGMVSVNSLLIAALNIVLTVILAPAIGVWGVIGGTFLALLIGSLRFTERVLKLFDLPLGDFLAGVMPTAALALALAIPPAALALIVGTPSGRLTAILFLPLRSLPTDCRIGCWRRISTTCEKLRFPWYARLSRSTETAV